MALPAPRLDTLQEAVEAALRTDGTIQDAAKVLEQYVRSNTHLRNELTEAAIPSLCLAAMRSYNQKRVTAPAWNAGLPAPAPRPMTAVAASARPSASEQAKINARRALNHTEHLLSMIRLPGGGMLKDATYKDVIEAAGFYGRQGRTMLHKERWLHAIGRAMDPKKAVGSTLSEERLRQLQEDAREAGDA